MAGLKVPTYERQTRFVSAYRGPTASPQAFGSDIGKGLTALGAGITDVGLAQMQRQAQRQEAEDLNTRQTFKLGYNDDVYKDLLANRDADTVSSENSTEAAQGRWKKLQEARLQEMLKTHKPSRKALDAMRRDAELIQHEFGQDHVAMVDAGRRVDILDGAGRNIQLIQASAAEHGKFNSANAEMNEALEAARKVLPLEDYLKVETAAREGMGRAVVNHLVRVQDKALLAKDHKEREDYHAQADALIDEAVTLGYIDGAEADKTKQIWHAGFDARASESLDARSRLRVLGGAPADAQGSVTAFLHSKLVAGAESTIGFRGDFARSLAGFLQEAPPELQLGILSGTRTYEHQKRLYDDDVAEHGGKPSGQVAKPGFSRHEAQYGSAADLSWNGKEFKYAPPEVKKWVKENAARFGLGFPVPGEDWHIEGPRGGPAARGKSLIDAVVQVESGGDPGAVSSAGASGIMQVMPETAKEIARDLGDVNFPATGGESDIRKYLSNRETGMRYGTHYLNKMLDRYNGDTEAALIAYNGGPARADAFLKAGRDSSVLPAETRAYVGKVMNAMGGPVAAGAPDQGIYGPQGNSFDRMPADTRRKIIEGAQGEMARGNEVLKNDVTDYVAWLRAGNEPDGRYSTEELTYRMGDQLGQVAAGEIAAAAAHGAQVRALEMATPEQVQAIRDENAKALSGPEGYRQNAEDAARIDQIVAARDKAIAEDPGGYVADKDKTTRAAAGKYEQRGITAQEKQAAAFAWAAASTRAQDLLGVPKDQQRILPDALVNSIAAQFSSKQPGGQNAAQLMAGLEATWGKHWEQVFEQLATDGKLPGTALVVGAMNRPSQNVARTLLAESALIGTEGLEKLVTPETVRDIKAGLHETTADFAATLANNGVSGANTYGIFNESVKQLALTYARTQGLDAQDALAKAKVDILDNAYTFMDTYRVPIEMDADTVDQWANEYQRRVDPAELMHPASLAGIHPDDVAAAYYTQVQANGYWVTSDNEDGLTLYDEQGSAVRRTDGKPYTVKWKDLTGSTDELTYPAIVGMGEQPGRPLVPGSPEAEAALFESAAAEGAPPAVVEQEGIVEDYTGERPSGGVSSYGDTSPLGATTTEPQERTLGATEPKPREARAADARISQPQRRLLVQGMSLEQSSRMARTGGTPREVLIALTGSEKPTRAEVEAVIADLEAKIPGSGGNKEELLEMLRLAGRAIR